MSTMSKSPSFPSVAAGVTEDWQTVIVVLYTRATMEDPQQSVIRVGKGRCNVCVTV